MIDQAVAGDELPDELVAVLALLPAAMSAQIAGVLV